AGMGETTIRLDVSYGDGVYKSTDAGRTWKHMGLAETKHIGRICIHPENPDIAYVAALGDIFGDNDHRGVYRTMDGGLTWQLVLHRDSKTGAIDMSIDPGNPRVLFASLWQTRRNFWNISSGGPGCGLFRSMDGGDTWEEITAAPGLPGGMLGKIGVTISPAQSGRVWALIEAAGETCGLYRSDDYGGQWKLVCNSRDLMHRPWYYTHVFADPYVTNLNMWKSTDGGASFTEIMTSHGDNHDLWIDPADPSRMIEGNDGGAQVTFNGGITWSSIYNQLTGQFYRIDVDNQYPYHVYGTQQDNTSIAVPSASVWGAITLGDCFYPGTGESGFIAVHPDDHNIVYVGAVGSSPGGAGALQRYDHRTQQIQLINVWPEQSAGVAPRDLKYRFAWTYPILFSPHDPGTLYVAGNHVFRSRDEGMSWQPISPDLSLNEPSRQDHSGGDVTRESAGAEVHATCASVVESKHRKGEIWAATDDGLVHVTRDDGGSWQNVTPPGMPALAYVGCVEISSHDADTVYLAATRYKLADYEPYLFRTTDGGKTWQSINGDFPASEITRVLRADPVQPGLLFVGTETTVHFSADDGASWARLPGGLPVVPVYDLKIKGTDLIAGTHGRAFWILDDISPLRSLAAAAAALLPPRTAVRTKLHFAALGGLKPGTTFALAFGIAGAITTHEMPDGSRRREYLDIGENPPIGAVLHYWLEENAGPVTLTFRDAHGNVVIALRSDDKTIGIAKRPTAKPGLNRYVWDLKYPGPTKIDASLFVLKVKPLVNEPDGAPGPTVAPGSYTVDLAVGGVTHSVPLTVVGDPRLATTDKDYAEQLALLHTLNAAIGRGNAAVNRIRRLKRQLTALSDRLGPDAALGPAIGAAGDGLTGIEGVLVDVHRVSPRDTLRNPSGLTDTLAALVAYVSNADNRPTSQGDAIVAEKIGKLDGELDRLETLIATDIAAINHAAGNGPHVGA
ncbi:MAG: glycosyl hydrolase, partial [Alphaproteobacteria bacterium]|nr:glycosyl hydrolase [Alphaproteobacteria bacterium]